jgi:hypothetical protein
MNLRRGSVVCRRPPSVLLVRDVTSTQTQSSKSLRGIVLRSKSDEQVIRETRRN